MKGITSMFVSEGCKATMEYSTCHRTVVGGIGMGTGIIDSLVSRNGLDCPCTKKLQKKTGTLSVLLSLKV